MQKLKDLIKLSNLCNFQFFASNIEGNISHQKLRNGPFARWHHLILRPESFRVFLSCANYGFCHLNLAGITKFKYEQRKTKRILVVVVKWRHRANGPLLGGKKVNEPYVLCKISSFRREFLRNHSVYWAQIFRDNWNCYALSIFSFYFISVIR